MPSRGVRQVAVPPAARRLSALERIDYEDGFSVATGPAAAERTAEEWARAILEDAPAATRRALRAGWQSLGLRIGPADDEERVLGWEVRQSTPDVVLLGAGSHLGLAGELLLQRRARTLFFATFVRLDNPAARAVWAGVIPVHQQIVARLLAGAARPAGGSDAPARELQAGVRA